MATQSSPPDIVDRLLHHIVLPPNVPGRAEANIERINYALIGRLAKACDDLRNNSHISEQISFIQRALKASEALISEGDLSKQALLDAFSELKTDDLLIVHVTEQNAALLIKRFEDHVTFETFESSLPAETVLTAQNAVECHFPAATVKIPNSVFDDPSFLDNLANFLQQAANETVKEFAAKSDKAKSGIFDSRDTVDPCLITTMLMTLLEVNGEREFPPLLRKRIRDQVCWEEGATDPWRRCPFWLVLRVATQRECCTRLSQQLGQIIYKLLVSLMLVQLLKDAIDTTSLEQLAFTRTKLSRRLAKLEVDKDRLSTADALIFKSIFRSYENLFHEVLQKANLRLETEWAVFKQSVQRIIPQLPQKADRQSLILEFRNSAPKLKEILADPYMHGFGTTKITEPDITKQKSQLSCWFQHFFKLSRIEDKLSAPSSNVVSCGRELSDYLTLVGSSYDTIPEHKSIMILKVMELWVELDKNAVRDVPLLRAFNPGFPINAFDTLQLPQYKDMVRLHKVEQYLESRHAACGYSTVTIFAKPQPGCFADRYCTDPSNSSKYIALRKQIETKAESMRRAKELEWQESSQKYEDLQNEMAVTSCKENGSPHDRGDCRRCWLGRVKKRLKIEILEHPLPSDEAGIQAVLLELHCPHHFAVYRDLTWRVLGTLGRQDPPAGEQPCVLLREYPPLKGFDTGTISSVNLASRAISFSKTHNQKMPFPVKLQKICVPNGLVLGYFDKATATWPDEFKRPSFVHHCKTEFPPTSALSSVVESASFAIGGTGPSSYEVIASQTKCPLGINLQEFLSFQALFSGHKSRWASILRELGSSNLHFSSEATNLLISRLASQVGPSDGEEPLRQIHYIFKEVSFCEQFLQQLNWRLHAISSNWRETQYMDLLITLILRLLNLSPVSFRNQVLDLLSKARKITFEWMELLKTEAQNTEDPAASLHYSTYTLNTCMLCKRTFDMNLDKEALLDEEDLHCFFACSMALQNNLPDYESLSKYQRAAFIRDTKMTYRFRSILRRSLEASPESLLRLVDFLWPDNDKDSSNIAPQKFFETPDHLWVMIFINNSEQSEQCYVHYSLLEGHLLINNRTLGKLPDDVRNSQILQRLFGRQNLAAWPSTLRGMTHTLINRPNGHVVHVGRRKGQPVVRACFGKKVWEYISPDTFGNYQNCDLPWNLIVDRVHWMDVATGIIEIRQKHIWKPYKRNWFLDFRKRSAHRNFVPLINPHCRLANSIHQIFDRFEFRQYLTITQPGLFGLTVSLERLDLSFSVNRDGLLECPALQKEIDPNQDAGTWYGFRSKLVLRDSKNPHQRSIIAPLGELEYRRDGIHVAVNVIPTGLYGVFPINHILGRVDCAAEPRLLYSKALFHACSSFLLPDPLTGRSGTDEALHCLRSCSSQPWTPLDTGSSQVLAELSKLVPARVYHPPVRKSMQKVSWNSSLFTIIQDERLMPAIQEIFDRSNQLAIFSINSMPLATLKETGEAHLLIRALTYRSQFRCPEKSTWAEHCPPDMSYSGRKELSKPRANVFEIVSLLKDWETNISFKTKLRELFDTSPSIEGFSQSFDQILLSDRLTVDFKTNWGGLVQLARETSSTDKYSLMFLFAAFSFQPSMQLDYVRILVAFAVIDELKDLALPEWPSYEDFRFEEEPSLDRLMKSIETCAIQFSDRKKQAPRRSNRRRKATSTEDLLEWEKMEHEAKVKSDCKALAEFLLEQWPCRIPNSDGFSFVKEVEINVKEALRAIKDEWHRLFKNLEFAQHLEKVQEFLDQCPPRKFSTPDSRCEGQEVFQSRTRGQEFPGLLQNLLHKDGPVISLPDEAELPQSHHPVIPASSNPLGQNPASDSKMGHRSSEHRTEGLTIELSRINKIFLESESGIRRQYAHDLDDSVRALTLKLRQEDRRVQEWDLPSKESISTEISKAYKQVKTQFDELCGALNQEEQRFIWLQYGEFWPSITKVLLLEHLRSSMRCRFGSGMSQALISFALSVSKVQQLTRIDDAYRKGKTQILDQEKINLGHENWNPTDYPDWLLLEIDSNVLIRKTQVEVALATISPASSNNSVLQMNMGQGKTSIIIPMVTAVLANEQQLCRIIVPKPLLAQSGQLFHARLGGLLGRDMIHVPFSRRTPTTIESIKNFRDLHNRMLKHSGFMLCLPEHILSFKLSGLQCLSDSRVPEAESMIITQKWIDHKCRDVLDESDVTLAVRTQLIYPSGSLTAIDFHPHRWEIIQVLLSLVETHLWSLQQQFPRSLKVVHRLSMDYPFVFFLRTDAEDALTERLVDSILSGRSGFLSTSGYSEDQLEAIRRYISESAVSQRDIQQIKSLSSEKADVKKTLHLLRGLLVHRILLLALKKRWNVQYGLSPIRDPIAVPFTAKGVPSEQSEFGYPDVVLSLTCLAFYYEGLSKNQLRECLEIILRSDDPSHEYERWIQSSPSLPNSLRDWNALNVEDDLQVAEIWQHLRHSTMVINYFLNHAVFPKHAKQFTVKLSLSGFDIPLFNPTLKMEGPSKTAATTTTKALTTGFSGTNDNKTMLPLNIKQDDLPELSHTNAEVLTYLLQERNRKYEQLADNSGQHLNELGILQKLHSLSIRILIDAGAQILEMDNATLARTWLLEVDTRAPAVVYFNSENRPVVLHRQRLLLVPLAASPFSDDLGECLVYLDQAHTRGTDLKLPQYARGALTLGLGQTKDHTVQAVMRLRHVATSQSVTFFAPPEVHQSILDLRSQSQPQHLSRPLDSKDVIRWLLEQTCAGIEEMQPLSYAQGSEYCKRMEVSELLKDSKTHQLRILDVIRGAEHQSLKQLYEPKVGSSAVDKFVPTFPKIKRFWNDLQLLRKGFQNTGSKIDSSAFLQEVEQEREVAFEVEAVRQVMKPVHYSPLKFPGLHADIITFARSGHLVVNSTAYEHAFLTLKRTAPGAKYNINLETLQSKFFVSKEFSKTVKLLKASSHDQFQRPVNWILWSSIFNTAMVVIPEEAESLIPILQSIKKPRTFLITYAAPLTRRMLHFNDLRYFSIPTLTEGLSFPDWLSVELGIFAGRLYFTYDEYALLLSYLGSSDHCEPEEPGTAISLQRKPFSAEPLSFLQDWLTIKVRGQGFIHTPMGAVLQGKQLTADHPFFKGLEVSGTKKPVVSSRVRNADSEDEGEDFLSDDGYFEDCGEFLSDGEVASDGDKDDTESQAADTEEVGA